METNPADEWWFAIAEAIGGATVDELKVRMRGREFVEWQVYLGRKAARERQAAGR